MMVHSFICCATRSSIGQLNSNLPSCNLKTN
uniref:Uncharacterized protein n=1 Tax=Rhizophora mucronata TaxID=61149 RepID=A0A2P2NE87_RHIMU